MKIYKRISMLLLVGAICIPSVMKAQDQLSGEASSNEMMGFSVISRDAAHVAKGFSGLANSQQSAWASFNNAAVLPFSAKRFDVGVLYQNWAPNGLKSSNIGAGLSTKIGRKFGVTLGFLSQRGESFPMINESGNAAGTAIPKDMQANLGLAYKIGDVVAIGINGKYFNSALTDEDAYHAFATDIFANCHIANFSFAAGMSNLGPNVKNEDGQEFSLPTAVALGADYLLSIAKVHELNADLDFNYFLSGNTTLALGLEYGFNEMVFVRAGYHYGSQKAVLPSFASVGLGIQFFGVRLDFAYLMANEFLANTMTFGLGFSF